jgi:PAS domain S-box-containing protein
MSAAQDVDPALLERALRDLANLSNLAEGWIGSAPHEVADGLADTLQAIFQPELIFLSLNGHAEEDPFRLLRVGGQSIAGQRTAQLQQQVEAVAAGDERLGAVPHPIRAGTLQLQVQPVGRGGAGGCIALGDTRAALPAELQSLLLTAIAKQAAVWSRQARLVADRQDVEQHLGRVNALGGVFGAERDLEHLLQAVTDVSTELIGAEYGAFFYNVVSEQGERSTLYSLAGPPNSAFAQFAMPRNTPVFGPTFSGTHVVRSDNITADPRYGQLAPYHGLPPEHVPVTSYLAVPVISGSGAVFGGLFFGHAQAGQFTPYHERLIVGLSGQVAIAIDNARLYQALAQARHQLEARFELRTAELLQSEARFHLLIDAVQDYAIYMLDPEGRVASWNAGAARIKGYAPDEIIGQHFSRFYTPADAAAGQPARNLALAQERGHFEAEGWRVRKDGSRFWANVVITPVYAPTGELVGYAKVTRDLTDRVRMENDLRQSREQLRELSHHIDRARENERSVIAREIHDELGGTLTGLKMDLKRLKHHIDSAGQPKLDEYAKAIDAAVQSVRRISQELRPAVLDDFGLLAALEWQLREFERRSGIVCGWDCKLGKVAVPDAATISVFRVFQESLTNIARHANATEVHVTCGLVDQQLLLNIEDNGVGIEPDRVRGTGSLGLVGMRERVSQHGGTVTIRGQPGKGTTVEVLLPLQSSPN